MERMEIVKQYRYLHDLEEIINDKANKATTIVERRI